MTEKSLPEEAPSTYWFVFSGIEAHKALVKKMDEEYL